RTATKSAASFTPRSTSPARTLLGSKASCQTGVGLSRAAASLHAHASVTGPTHRFTKNNFAIRRANRNAVIRAEIEVNEPVRTATVIQKIALLGDYLPRKCGIATFTSDLLAAVAAEHPQSQCFAVPVN